MGYVGGFCPFFGASRDRTDDLLLAKQMLSQLSYSPKIINEVKCIFDSKIIQHQEGVMSQL